MEAGGDTLGRGAWEGEEGSPGLGWEGVGTETGVRCQEPQRSPERDVKKQNAACGWTGSGTSLVGLAGHQFCRYLGEKALSYCGEKGESPSEAQQPQARAKMGEARHGSLHLRGGA